VFASSCPGQEIALRQSSLRLFCQWLVAFAEPQCVTLSYTLRLCRYIHLGSYIYEIERKESSRTVTVGDKVPALGSQLIGMQKSRHGATAFRCLPGDQCGRILPPLSAGSAATTRQMTCRRQKTYCLLRPCAAHNILHCNASTSQPLRILRYNRGAIRTCSVAFANPSNGRIYY
jgi:hypothetical protein